MSSKAETTMKRAKSSAWSARIDLVVGWLKWPSAVLATALIPLLAWSLLQLLLEVLWRPLNLIPYAAGAAVFVLLWRRWLGNTAFGKFLITLEHESTHALFALLTFHRIIRFRATMGKGGEVRYRGQGNWLITVAPYFFPTAALLLFLIAFIVPFPALPWQSFLLGVAMAYHVISTYRETHKDQTDIQELGLTFCWMFLPAANLAVVGLLTSFGHDGSDGLHAWFASIWEPLRFFNSLLGGSE